MKDFAEFMADDSGQGTTEYAMILGIIVIGAIAIAIAFRTKLGEWFTEIQGSMKNQ